MILLKTILKSGISILALVGFLTVSAVLAAGLVFFDMFWIEPNWIEVTKVTIHDPVLSDAMGNLRVVQISDIHLENGITGRERRLIEKVNALRPDLLFFTGDLIDDKNQIEAAIKIFKSFRVKIGIYAVPGNTDHIVMDAKSLGEALAPAGINLLVNETRKFRTRPGHFIWIVGVDDPKYGYSNLAKALEALPGDVPKIALAHAPVAFDAMAGAGVNLLLVGDTHGGQVGIPWLVRFSEYASRSPYLKGLFRKGATQMYVNRGIGMKTRPIRFLCRPEITVFEFVK